MKTTVVLVILTAGLSSLAAQDTDRKRPERPQRPDPARIFNQADLDQDGFLDLTELTALRDNMPTGRGGRNGGPRGENADTPPPEDQRDPGARRGRQMPSAEDMMAAMDKNKDGKLAPEEFTLGNRRGRGGPGEGEGRRAKRPE